MAYFTSKPEFDGNKRILMPLPDKDGKPTDYFRWCDIHSYGDGWFIVKLPFGKYCAFGKLPTVKKKSWWQRLFG